jgi:hypothetical protein
VQAKSRDPAKQSKVQRFMSHLTAKRAEYSILERQE